MRPWPRSSRFLSTRSRSIVVFVSDVASNRQAAAIVRARSSGLGAAFGIPRHRRRVSKLRRSASFSRPKAAWKCRAISSDAPNLISAWAALVKDHGPPQLPGPFLIQTGGRSGRPLAGNPGRWAALSTLLTPPKAGAPVRGSQSVPLSQCGGHGARGVALLPRASPRLSAARLHIMLASPSERLNSQGCFRGR